LDVGQTSSTIPRSASSATRAGSSTARTPWEIRVTPGSASPARIDSGPAHSPAWTVQPRPASWAMAKTWANGAGGKPASSPAMLKPTTYGWGIAAASRAVRSAASTPKLRTTETRTRPSIPWASRASSIPRKMPSRCSASVRPTARAWSGDEMSST
jgi:hypothetical protein